MTVERLILGCSSNRVKTTRNTMQKNLLSSSFRRGVLTSVRAKITQQLRYLMSSSLSALSRARNDKQAGATQHTRLVSRQCDCSTGLSTNSAASATSNAQLGLRVVFSSMILSCGMLSRALSRRGSMKGCSCSMGRLVVGNYDKMRPHHTMPQQWPYAIVLNKERAPCILVKKKEGHESVLMIWSMEFNLIQFLRRVRIKMDDYFVDNDEPQQPPAEQPVPAPVLVQNPVDWREAASTEAATLDFSAAYASSGPPGGFPAVDDGDNDFDDFEEDEMTKRIREEEERIQNRLREKSEQEWQDKQKRKQQGRQNYQRFMNQKEEQKRARAEDNLRKEEVGKQELATLNEEAGWRKVVTNVNLKQGEYQGKKQINRMREAILHRREDDAR